MCHVFTDRRIISKAFTGIAATLPAVITAVRIGAVTGHGPEVMEGPYNRTYPGEIRDILNSQKTVMGIMKMDQVDLMFLQKVQDILSAVTDMQTGVTAVSGDQTVEHAHEEGIVENMNAFRKHRMWYTSCPRACMP